MPIVASDRNDYAKVCITESTGVHSLEDIGKCIKKVRVVTLRIDYLLRVLNIDEVDVVKIEC